jgi:replicative DNA helicase
MTENIHYSKELEAAILGACLLEKTAFGRIYGIIEKETFYFDANKTVFEKLNWIEKYCKRKNDFL